MIKLNYIFFNFPKCLTERHGRVVSNPALYSGDPIFKYRPATVCSEFFRKFPPSLQTYAGTVS
jgi:hypothetical protein